MPEERTELALTAAREPYRIAYLTAGPTPGQEPVEASVPLSHYLWILKRHRWKILAFVFTCVGAAAVISSRLTPVYEATATVDIDRQTPTGVLGQEAMRSTTNDADQFLATQVKLIQSDSVLRPVAAKYNLLELERGSSDPQPANAALAQDAPVLLKKLQSHPAAQHLPPADQLPVARPAIGGRCSQRHAQSYLEHTYNIRYRSSASLSSFMEKQLEELKAKMERSGAALVQFERELNVISPEEKTSILSARLLQLNTEYTNAQADRVRKEAAYKSVADGTFGGRPGLHPGRIRAQASRAPRRSAAEVRGRKDALSAPTIPSTGRRRSARRITAAGATGQGQNIAQRVDIEYREAHQP